jgi:lactate dehydrogenase-like 2-hydroxyacid dehydrogenase
MFESETFFRDKLQMKKPGVLMIGPYPEWEMPVLETAYEIHKPWQVDDKDAYINRHGVGIRAVATRGDLGASADLIASLPDLEMIACFGVGTDAIDLKAAKARGIKVSYTPDVLTGDVADLAIGLCIAVARMMPQGDVLVRDHKWPQGTLPLATRFFGKRMGIVGLGRIGMAIAKRAAGFDMEISYHNRNKRADVPYHYCETVEALAAQSDFLVAAVAGGAGSKAMISSAALIALGPEGYFINVARGSVVDEAALLHSLENGVIKGAGLDVYLNEPDIDPRFMKLKNIVVLPHVGSGTFETRKAMGKLVRDNLEAHFAGKPLLTPVPA